MHVVKEADVMEPISVRRRRSSLEVVCGLGGEARS